jgi:nucleotide-binding universal stress UspA family protein
MVAIERILCAVDLSECSRTALIHALALSRWYRARLTVLHVFRQVTTVEATAAGLGMGAYAPVGLATIPRAEVETQVQAFVAGVPGTADVDVAIVEAGNVRETILAQAQALRADLLVLGSHGLTGLQRLMLGSIAESVLRHAPIPVLIVPPHAPAVPESGVPFKRIVCAVDFEADSYPAVHHALNLAQESDSELTLLHVLQVPVPRRVAGEAVPLDVDAARQTLAQLARKRLDALVPDEARAYCSVHAEVTEGRPADEILRFARDRSADLVIMGVRGRDALDVALFGSQTRTVVHEVQCPVLTVRQE